MNSPITLDEVKAALNKVKNGKAFGTDDIPTEVLKNPKAERLLGEVIQQCFEAGEVPEYWLRGVINPIPKCSSKDPRVPMNYRGITIGSIPCKVYSTILNARLTTWLESNQVISDSQNGYRKNRSCLDHLYTIASIIQTRKEKRKSTFVCYVDAQKAFDSVNRMCLWYKLQTLGIHGQFLKALQSLYEDYKCCVRINEEKTNWFSVPQGVKQGCPISPTLFFHLCE